MRTVAGTVAERPDRDARDRGSGLRTVLYWCSDPGQLARHHDLTQRWAGRGHAGCGNWLEVACYEPQFSEAAML